MVDPEKKLKWATVLDKFEYTGDQRSGAGTPFYFILKGFSRPIRVEFVFREWLENNKLVACMTSSNFVKDYEQTYALEPAQSGTRLDFAEKIQWPYGIVGKIFGLLAKRRVTIRVMGMLAILKNLAEA